MIVEQSDVTDQPAVTLSFGCEQTGSLELPKSNPSEQAPERILPTESLPPEMLHDNRV